MKRMATPDMHKDGKGLYGKDKCPHCHSDLPELSQANKLAMEALKGAVQDEVAKQMGGILDRLNPVLEFVDVEMKSSEFRAKRESLKIKEKVDE